MKLFEVINGTPTPTVECLLIPHFKKIWDRDKSKTKEVANNELSYIYFYTDYKSIYIAYPTNLKEEKLGEDFMNDGKYKPDQLILEACVKYEELQQTPTMNFLKAARHAMQETENYFNNIDYTERDVKGNAVYKVTDVTRALKDCSGVKDTLDKLLIAVKKELATSKDVARGGGTGGEFEFSED